MRISADTEIVAAWISWEKAIKMYPRKLLGGIEDRRESHNVNTGAVYLYKSEEDFRIKSFPCKHLQQPAERKSYTYDHN